MVSPLSIIDNLPLNNSVVHHYNESHDTFEYKTFINQIFTTYEHQFYYQPISYLD